MTDRIIAFALTLLLVVGAPCALSGCARNGLGGYEFPKIMRILP